MKLMIELTPETQERIIIEAIKLGYRREFPNRAWTGKEKREVTRWFIGELIVNSLTG